MRESALHAHRLLLRIGLAIAHAFAWVFVFEYFYLLSGDMARALAASALLYASAQFITLVMTPIAAAHLSRGIRQSLVWGTLAASSAFILLGASLSGQFNDPPFWGIVVFAVLIGFYRALYWVPYKLASTALQPHQHMRAYLEVLIALMPLFAGLTAVSMQFGPVRLLFGAAVLIMLSVVFALFLPNIRERFSWSYAYTFKQLWRRKNHGLVLESFLEGIQGAALFLVWPLAIFLIVEWSYFTLGLVFSITLLAILLLRRLYRYLHTSFNLGSSATVHTLLVASGWVARLAAGTPVGIVIADVYSYTTLPERGVLADPFTFEHASDRGAFIDEYTVLKEIALAAGRIMLCVLVFSLSFAFDIAIVFAAALLIAAVASGISALIAQRTSIATY
ncbi:hypothetical protein A2853_02625 [Candidatus Kaiserbacteria bacterium RIFCSPHIGHO2_01_FULL_55_17]|uniref:Major facilitator superfamily (MFS) profile domain-containing protein n=1 Tax=Candidatus Kaiserbacteria bacterium RIFCSPHIGHO2_01_FULL_55_17 TaxID=1798484 RepID=A0A1F6D7H7_9BACT|nr:MAG: hypothetical protein A2853_02625 [Candidatus Kaiserbacteria bacterium RIFCSPHIGHO2_01_FULL_55_17]